MCSKLAPPRKHSSQSLSTHFISLQYPYSKILPTHYTEPYQMCSKLAPPRLYPSQSPSTLITSLSYTEQYQKCSKPAAL